MAPKKGKAKDHYTIVRGRDAENGRFIPVAKAEKNKKGAIVDRMKVHKKKGK